MLTHIDLFSGIGGFSLAAESCGLRTVVFVERDAARQRDLGHHWPGVPIIADVNDVEAIERAVVADAESRHGRLSERTERRDVPELVRSGEATRRALADGQREQNHEEPQGANEDETGRMPDRVGGCDLSPFLLTAGVPCQPASSAGKRKGSGDDRWLWPQTLRVVERLRPRWCVFENPLGLASLALPAAIPDVDLARLRGVPGRTIAEIIRGLDILGYDLPRDRDGVAWVPVVPAVGVGAFHGRDRLWVVARRRDVADAKLPASQRHGRTDFSGIPNAESEDHSPPGAESCAPVDHPDGARLQQRCEMHAGSGGLGSGKRTDSADHGSSRQLPDWRGAVLETGADGITRPVKPGLRLLAHGIPGRVAKLRGFGNAVVPQVAQEIIRSITAQLES